MYVKSLTVVAMAIEEGVTVPSNDQYLLNDVAADEKDVQAETQQTDSNTLEQVDSDSYLKVHKM